MQERVYKTAVRDTADLKRRLNEAPLEVIETWLSIPQTVIDEAIDEWGLRLRQSKGTSLRALADAVTNRLFSEPPSATTQQPALVRAIHILSKKIVCLSISNIL